MGDIIQDAKKLLKLVDEERADLESRGAEPDEYGGFEMWLDSTVLYDNAKEVREAIKALAEETWEYAAQAKRGENWETCTNLETHLEEWWENKDDAEWAVGRLQEQGHKARIVRRRVSPVEVCCQS